MVGKQTTKIASGVPTTQPLPRATVKLQPTATPSAPISSVNVRTAGLDDEEEEDEGPLNIMGWVALVGAIAALIGVLASWQKVDFFYQGDLSYRPGDPQSRADAVNVWRKATPPDGFKLATDFSPFDKKDGSGGVISEYKDREPDTPTRPAFN
jgi:hypothetical protein